MMSAVEESSGIVLPNPTLLNPIEEAENVKNQANVCYKNAEYKNAKLLYSKAILLHPTNPTYYLNRAASETMLKQFDEAITDCRKLQHQSFIQGNFMIMLFDKASKCYLSIGNVHEALSQLKLAKAICEENGSSFITQLPQLFKEISTTTQIESFHSSCMNNMNTSQYAEALKDIENTFSLIEPTIKKYGSGPSKFKADALTNIPSLFRIYRAQCLVECLEYTEANADMQKLLQEDSRNSDALTVRATTGYILDLYPLAQIQQLLQNALAYDPDNKRARELNRKIKQLESIKTIGNEAFSQRDWMKSIDLYSQCIEMDTFHGVYSVKALSNRANVKSKMNEYEQAIEDCVLALEMLQNLCFPKGSTDLSSSDLQNSYQSGLFYKIHLRRADCLMKQEKYEEAIRDYSLADGIKPGDQQIKQSIQQANKLLKMSKRKDWYKILGVDKDASETEIKKAYRKCALQYHPDKQVGFSESEQAIAEEKFKDISAAYDILNDSQKKHMFDNGLDMDGSHSHESSGGVPMDDIINMMFSQQSRGGGGASFGGHSFGGHSFGGQRQRGGFPQGFDFE